MYKINTKQLGIPPGYIYKILLIMRLTTVLLIATIMQVSAGSFAQKISLNEKNAPLEKIFDKIRLQSGYDFLFNRELLKTAKPVDINIKNVDIEDALAICFKGQPFTYTLEEKTIVIKAKTPSFLERLVDRFSAVDVRGMVLDENHQYLSGASVRVKNGKGTALTNEKGEFYIKNVEEGATLEITYIGYTPLEVKAKPDLGILKLELSDSKLDEVQISAYGITSQRMSTGNIGTIKASDIEKQPINNPLLALAGRIPGLTVSQTSGLPGAAVKVQIRGQNSLNDSKPLFIIDGLPYQNDIAALGGPFGGPFDSNISAFSFINPNDIESIDVLKDADATAIYGSRGANGVILITTKKGQVGAAKLNLNFQSGVGEVTRKMKLLNKDQYLEMRQEAFKNDGVVFNPDDPYKAFAAPDLFYWDTTRYTDWQKEMIGGTAHYSDYQASVSGGTNNVQYIVGGNFHKENTVFPGQTGDNKANAHFSISGSSSDQKFKTTLTGSYMSNWNNYAREDYTKYITLSPVLPKPFKEDGSLNWEPLIGFGFDDFQFASFSNPYSKSFQPFSSKVNSLTTSSIISYRLLPFLSLKANVGYSSLVGDSYIAVNPYSSLPSNDVVNGTILRESQFNSSNIQSFSFEPQINLIKSVSKGILNVLIGGSYQSSNNQAQNIIASGFSIDNLMQNPGAATTYLVGKGSSEYKYVALFSRLTYDWDKKYLINLNFRRDGSSRFGPRNQFGNFASVGTAWIFTEENFVKHSMPFLSFGKLRASYGASGNDGIPNYAYLDRYNLVNGNYQGVKGLSTQGLFNPYYSWEITRKGEVALELGFLKDRILLQSAYYRNRSSNQLVTQPLPSMSGPGSLIVNLPALIQNSGMEVSLNTINIKTQDFTWSTSFNISQNKNKLVDFPNIEQSTFYTYLGYRIGEPIGITSTYKLMGVNQNTGQYQFLDHNGNLVSNPSDPADRIVTINTAPKYFGGISNSFSYKNFSIDVFFQAVKQVGKNYLFSFGNMPGYMNAGNLSNQPIEVLLRWQKLGDVSSVQGFSGNVDFLESYNKANNSDQSYSDASFIRLKNLSMSYMITNFLKNKSASGNMKIFVQGQNLFTITKFKGLDPENQSVTSLPPLRIITGGIQLTF